MSRQCPACGHTLSIWRWKGPVEKHQRKEGSSWLRYAPRQFFCRACGTEIRPLLLPLGYALWCVMAVLFVLLAWVTLGRQPETGVDRLVYLAPLFGILCMLAAFIGVRWGIRFTPVPSKGGGHE
jgi:hypothetical protein